MVRNVPLVAESPIPAEGRFPRVRMVLQSAAVAGGVALDAAAGAGKRGSCCGHWHGGSSEDHSCTHRNGACSTRTEAETRTGAHTPVSTQCRSQQPRGSDTVSADRRRARGGRPHGPLLSLQEEKHVLTQAPSGGERSRADAEGKCCESHSCEVPGRRQRGDGAGASVSWAQLQLGKTRAF